MSDFAARRSLGRTGLMVSRIALSGGYKAPDRAVERAYYEHNVNAFYWEGRKPGMQAALRRLAKAHRDDLVIAVQSYDHSGFFVERSAEKALRALGIACADIFFLGWYQGMPRERVLEAARRLKEAGKVRFVGITGHDRGFHRQLAVDPSSPIDVHMIRYNAAHRGAESEVFGHLPETRPGIVTYTATRWGKLLAPNKMPPGEPPMTAAECYRFVLSHPAVDMCLAGPRSEEEMDAGLEALRQGPLSDDERARCQRIGNHVHG